MNSNDNKQPFKFTNIKPIEVIQPYKPQIIQFENTDDFNIYYNKHLEEFNETTYKLNIKYKIPGYKITKIKGQLKLIKDYSIKENSGKENKEKQSDINELKIRLEALEKANKIITEQINHITEYLSEQN